ncbi:MAG: ribonuclease Z [Candidatus Micrarchaeota archaeon]
MIRVVVLGSGGSLPSVERGTSAVAIRHSGSIYLFDCGEGTQRQMMKFGVSYAKVKAIFVTHLHADHFLGIAGLVETLALVGRKEMLEIFGPRGAKERLEEFVHLNLMQAKDISSDFIYKGDGFEIKPFNTLHYSNSVGFVFEEDQKRKFDEKKAHAKGLKGKMFTEIQEKGKLKIGGKTVHLDEISELKPGRKIVYTGDTMPCPETIEAAKGADLLIHDGTFGNELQGEAELKRHSTVSEAAKIAKKAGVKKLVLTHISNRYEDDKVLEREAREIFPESYVARDGSEFFI